VSLKQQPGAAPSRKGTISVMTAFYRVTFEAANTEDLRQAFALTDSSDSPVDLTGAQLQMGVETAVGVDAIAASTGNGHIIVHNAAAGLFSIAIPAAVMRTLPAGAYQHDLLLTLAGRVQRIWTGTLTLSRGITE
jgi:hypothetical protein